MSETPLLTHGMVAQLGEDIADAAEQARRAETQRDVHESDRLHFAAVEQQLSAVRGFIKPRIGRSITEVLEEAQAELDAAEAELARKAAVAEAARERVRDLEGYQRIARELKDAAPSSPELREGEQG